MGLNDTGDISALSGSIQAVAPAIVLVSSRGEPRCEARFIERSIVVGRDPGDGLAVDSDALSRRHFSVERVAEGWRVEDLGSSHGTYVNGVPIARPVIVPNDAVIRAGREVFLLEWHASRFANGAGVDIVDGHARGPAMRAIDRDIERHAARGVSLLVVGESGTGKERAAHVFHEASANANGPFVTFNCANIDANTATTQLFGAKKGAHSTADKDTWGAFGDADRGALFLDEVHHLAAPVQPKLLRAVETKRFQQLGSTASRMVDVLIVSATNVDLEQWVTECRFAADLRFRLKQAEVRLPPLRARREEVAYIVQLALAKEGVTLPVRQELIEACLLRTWTGNARELFDTVRDAAAKAVAEGAKRLEPKHLAGGPVSAPRPSVAPEAPVSMNPAIAALPKHRQAALVAFQEALERNGGSVKAAAEELQIELSTAYEWRDLLAGKPRRRR